MNTNTISAETIRQFEQYLLDEEKSGATIEKYLRDVRCFFQHLTGELVDKRTVMAYKSCIAAKYAPASVNSMLVAINCFLRFAGLPDCCVKLLKMQRQLFSREDRELTKEEYQRLVRTARQTQLSYVIQTICGTGIRVSELQYITVEAVQKGKAVINCKNKTRVIFIPVPLQKILKDYIKKSGIKAGSVFVSKGGRPLDRSNIWRRMKGLCAKAGVSPGKVFPHNLRHLFARTFYSLEKDVVRLADLLGHSSIDTTRIYTMETGHQHISRLERVLTALTT